MGVRSRCDGSGGERPGKNCCWAWNDAMDSAVRPHSGKELGIIRDQVVNWSYWD